MSLRYKILLAIIAVMILIMGVLTLSLWLTSLGRVEAEQKKMAELTRSVVQTIIAEVKKQEDWDTVRDKLNKSALFKTWVIVNESLEPIISSSPIEDPRVYKKDIHLKHVLHAREIFTEGNQIWAPIDLPGGETYGIKIEIPHLSWLEFNPMESVKVILWVMPLGAILLILSIYVLLNRLVLKPLEGLDQASRQIAEGKYEVKLPPATGKDEVSHLINTFNSMLKEIKEYQGNLETKIEEARQKIKATEDQLIIAQRLSATGTLAAGIAHEINNPLGGIMNAALALKRSDLEKGKARQYLDLIVDGLNRMQETLKKILQFFPRKLLPQPIDLKEIIDRAIMLIQHRLESGQIEVKNTVPTNLPRVFGEATELQQVFLNLLMNAFDAIMATSEKKGKPRGLIEISHQFDVPARGGAEAKNITIKVKDTGEGMSTEEISRAFDLFYTTKEPGKGTGLGLSVVHNIVENHGGKISIQSKKGRGITVNITLPLLKETIQTLMKHKSV